MKIENQYVTHEIAELLKLKGFRMGSNHYYGGHGWNVGDAYNIVREGLCYNNDPSYFDDVCEAPEIWLVNEWLRVNYGIWIEVDLSRKEAKFTFMIQSLKFEGDKFLNEYYNTPQDAYIAAIEYTLKNLI